MSAVEAVLIPGGGLLPTGAVTPWGQARLERAIAFTPLPQFYLPLSAGTTHKPPPLDDAGFPILEAIAAAHYLKQRGIAPDRILPEVVSLDTIGNAYFARVQHAEPLGLRRLHVITSAFHLARTAAIFTWIFQLSPPPQAYHLTFEGVPNVGLPPAALAARQQKEQAGLKRVLALRSRLTTLPALHRWLYTEHTAYAIGQQSTPLTDTAALDTY